MALTQQELLQIQRGRGRWDNFGQTLLNADKAIGDTAYAPIAAGRSIQNLFNSGARELGIPVGDAPGPTLGDYALFGGGKEGAPQAPAASGAPVDPAFFAARDARRGDPNAQSQPQQSPIAAASGMGGSAGVSGVGTALAKLYEQAVVEDDEARMLAIEAVMKRVAPEQFKAQEEWDKTDQAVAKVEPRDKYMEAALGWHNMRGGAGVKDALAFRKGEDERVRVGEADRNAKRMQQLGFARDAVTGRNATETFQQGQDETLATLLGQTSTPTKIKGQEALLKNSMDMVRMKNDSKTANKLTMADITAGILRDSSPERVEERKDAVLGINRSVPKERTVPETTITGALESFDKIYGKDVNLPAAQKLRAEFEIAIRRGQNSGEALSEALTIMKPRGL